MYMCGSWKMKKPETCYICVPIYTPHIFSSSSSPAYSQTITVCLALWEGLAHLAVCAHITLHEGPSLEQRSQLPPSLPLLLSEAGGWLGCASHPVGKSKSREVNKSFPLQIQCHVLHQPTQEAFCSPSVNLSCPTSQRQRASLLLLLSRFSRVGLCATPQTAAHQAPPVPGILQARTLEWVAISFSNA